MRKFPVATAPPFLPVTLAEDLIGSSVTIAIMGARYTCELASG
jgi:hypothetical protein